MSELKFKHGLGVSGEFAFTIIRPDGTIREEIKPHKNLILNQGLDLLLRMSPGDRWPDQFDKCRFGTGSTPPEVTDIGLTSPVGDASNNRTQYAAQWDQTPEPGIFRVRRTWRFEFNTAGSRGIANVQLSEVTVGTTNTAIAKSLVLDSQGNPTTIQLLPEEVLQVTYAFYIYLDTREVQTGTFIMNEGEEDEEVYDWTSQFYCMGNTSNTQASAWTQGFLPGRMVLGAQRELFSPTATSNYSGTNIDLDFDPYVNGSYSRSFSATLSISQGNISGGIGFIFLRRYFASDITGNAGLIQIRIARQSDGAAIPKDAEHRLTLESFFQFSLGRYEGPDEASLPPIETPEEP